MVSYTTLIIEDFEVFRKFVLSTLQRREEFQVIYQASDGLEGVQRAKELQHATSDRAALIRSSIARG